MALDSSIVNLHATSKECSVNQLIFKSLQTNCTSFCLTGLPCCFETLRQCFLMTLWRLSKRAPCRNAKYVSKHKQMYAPKWMQQNICRGCSRERERERETREVTQTNEQQNGQSSLREQSVGGSLFLASAVERVPAQVRRQARLATRAVRSPRNAHGSPPRR